jgi:hypothetical protein
MTNRPPTSSDRTEIVWDLAHGQPLASWHADHAVTAVGGMIDNQRSSQETLVESMFCGSRSDRLRVGG